jgi:hypothetical protein
VAKTKPVTLTNGVLSLNENGNYTFDFLPNGKIKILLDGGHATVLSCQEWESVSTFNLVKTETDLQVSAALLATKDVIGAGDLSITDLALTNANVGGNSRFEPNVNLDNIVGNLLNTRGVAGTIESLTVNGNKADAFKLVWDHLDDPYVAGGDYYNGPLNEAFVRVGIEYAKYLDAGGAPLIDTVAKFAADGLDADTLPERLQSMHDNLLGNVTAVNIQDRGFSPELKVELLALVPDGYEDRGIYSGQDSGSQGFGSANHDSVRGFDYDRGWSRPDYVEQSFGTVDLRAQDTSEGDMLFSDGNTATGYSLVRHEGAGVELALKVKHRGGADYVPDHVDADGTVHYNVAEGSDPNATSARAEWNFDYAMTKLAAGDNDSFTFKIFVDLDETAGVGLVEYTANDNPTSPFSVQNSGNYAFLRSLIDTDGSASGVQPYAFGDGVFTIELHAYDNTTDALLAVNRAVVHVGDAII